MAFGRFSSSSLVRVADIAVGEAYPTSLDVDTSNGESSIGASLDEVAAGVTAGVVCASVMEANARRGARVRQRMQWRVRFIARWGLCGRRCGRAGKGWERQ